MSAQTDALKTVQANIIAAINQAISTEGALKAKLDAALADNVAKAAQVADLQTQLAAAQAAAAAPEDTQAVVDTTAALQAALQQLSDANAVNAPAN